MHVLLPLKFCKFAWEEDVQAQDQDGDAWWLGKCQENYQNLSYIAENIRIELTRYFGIEKIIQLVAKKGHQTESSYLLIPTHKLGRTPITFRAKFPVSTNGKDMSNDLSGIAYVIRKDTNYVLIPIIIDRLTILHSKPAHMIDAPWFSDSII